MDELLNSVSSVRREFQQRRISRSRGANTSQSNLPQPLLSPKPPMPKQSLNFLPKYKNETERSTESSLLQRSTSQCRLRTEESVSLKINPQGNMTSRLKINDIQSELVRMNLSPLRSPTRSRIRDYKIDATKLLFTTIIGYMARNLRLLKASTDNISPEPSKRKPDHHKRSIGSVEFENSSMVSLRRSEREFSGQIIRKKDELWTKVMNVNGKFENQPTSILVSPVHNFKGFQQFPNTDPREERTPIVEVIYEENKQKIKDQNPRAYNGNPNFIIGLRSSQSCAELDHLQITSVSKLKENFGRNVSNKLVNLSVALMPAIKKVYMDSLYFIKAYVAQQPQSLSEEEFVLNNPPKKRFLGRDTSRSKNINIIGDLQSQIFNIRSSKNKMKMNANAEKFFSLITHFIYSYHNKNFHLLFQSLKTKPKDVGNFIEKVFYILERKLSENLASGLETLKSYNKSLNENKRVIKTLLKNIEKDIKYRLSACFMHWKTTASQMERESIYGSLKTITISQILIDLIGRQEKAFFMALKIANKKKKDGDREKLRLIYKGFRYLIPYYKNLKQKVWNRWQYYNKAQHFNKNAVGLALKRLSRIVMKNELRWYEKFMSDCKMFISLKKLLLSNACKIFKSKFRTQLGVWIYSSSTSKKPRRSFQKPSYNKTIPAKKITSWIEKQIKIQKKRSFAFFISSPSLNYPSALPLYKFKQLKLAIASMISHFESQNSFMARKCLLKWKLKIVNEARIGNFKQVYMREVKRTLASSNIMQVLNGKINHLVKLSFTKLKNN
ncbi:unnamed protein product [Blepharisma stoltei]|uniref:Uncharacterized protein n=1 Tax=Blepharisma stoltei TaxID=1481888 RepID=A0AAU9JW85_9CILI|nr:unnamed protein product [Blepharisma stoltei]